MDQSIFTSSRGIGMYFLASKGMALAKSCSDKYGIRITVLKVEKDGIEAITFTDLIFAFFITSLIPHTISSSGSLSMFCPATPAAFVDPLSSKSP